MAHMTREQITIGPDAPYEVRMIVEVPKGASNKYKYDPTNDTFRYDHTLYSPLYYPYDYGWVCGTRAKSDGKPLNCLVIAKNPTFPGCLIVVRPIGTLRMNDARGEDNKLLCVAVCDPRLEGINSLKDVSEHAQLEVRHFFEIYQTLEQREVQIEGWMDVDETQELIRASMAA